jgi:hypothetical protein
MTLSTSAWDRFAARWTRLEVVSSRPTPFALEDRDGTPASWGTFNWPKAVSSHQATVIDLSLPSDLAELDEDQLVMLFEDCIDAEFLPAEHPFVALLPSETDRERVENLMLKNWGSLKGIMLEVGRGRIGGFE